MSDRFGFSIEAWHRAKLEPKAAIKDRAKVRGMIAYSELVRHIRAISLEAHDTRFFALLGETTEEEDAAGRGMLSALVVHKVGDMQPGPGFFELAEHLARTRPIF